MQIRLEDLLTKLGVPEVLEQNQARWHYLDDHDPKFGGFADVRLEGAGKFLIADLRHWKKTVGDDFIDDKPRFESFHLLAERVADDLFRVREIAYDGKTYDADERPMIELGFSMFHARAVEINERMVAQRFDGIAGGSAKNPFEAVRAAMAEAETQQRAQGKKFRPPAAPARGVVIAFPRRRPPAAARA